MKPDRALTEKYNVPVPRYTSYPPANHFHDFGAEDYTRLMTLSNTGNPRHVAIYVHIPFCKKICFYCGCNSCLLKSNELVTEYIIAVKKEISMVSGFIDKDRKVSMIHFGGGTPNAIDVAFIHEIMECISKAFSFIDEPEIAIECHPATLDFKYIDSLISAKFNRFSLGIQDFNNGVLLGVNREPPAIPVKVLLEYLKSKHQLNSVNLDFIYGLPGQTISGFADTIKQATALRPDRIVTFSYAHVPWLKKHQQILEKKGLPRMDDKMDMFLISREILKDAGYIPIGLDHYVLPDDELNLALMDKTLHRNFQGYCSRRTTGQVYAFGASAISQMENGYSQNSKEVSSYISKIMEGKPAVEKGFMLSRNQIIIRDLITILMCNNHIDLNDFAAQHKISSDDLNKISGYSEDKLAALISDGMVIMNGGDLMVTELGSLFIRNIAACFDPDYKPQINQYSQPV